MLGFVLETASAGRRQRVELRASAQLANFPFGRDPASQFQLVKRGIQRSITHLELLAGDLLQSLADRPAVPGRERDDLQQQEIERPCMRSGGLLMTAVLGYRE